MPFNAASKNAQRVPQKLEEDSGTSYDDQNEHVVYDMFNQLDLDKDESPQKPTLIRNRQEIDFQQTQRQNHHLQHQQLNFGYAPYTWGAQQPHDNLQFSRKIV